MRIAVLTPALPHRLNLLAECVASIGAQTLQPVAHIIHLDYEWAGCAIVQNRMLAEAAASGAEWISLLADDDLVDPDHLETLAANSDGADIIYSWCRVEGRAWNPNRSFDEAALRVENYIPSTSLIRRSLIERLGGWRTDAAHGWEDWDFWLRALDEGAVFRCVKKVTWTYRFTSLGNLSMGTLPSRQSSPRLR